LAISKISKGIEDLTTVAVAVVCKTPKSGASKTRLSPPLTPDECAAISACFIRDLSTTIQSLAEDGDVTGYASYTPLGTETELRRLLPDAFKLVLQCEGNLGDRLLQATRDLLDAGHAGAILINSDSPTLPRAILRQAVDAVRRGRNVVLSPACDGGYTLIGLSEPHARLFENIPWSTVDVPGWYDVDDDASFRILEAEFSGQRPSFAQMNGADAPATRKFVRERQLVTARR
jgi:rSAM/selenodomain-associated transferase 1